jgi:hypothetical protein
MGEYKLRMGHGGEKVRCVWDQNMAFLFYYCMHAPQQKLELACYGESLLESMRHGDARTRRRPRGGVCCVCASRIVNTRVCEIRKKKSC